MQHDFSQFTFSDNDVCTQQNKRKAMYNQFTVSPSLQTNNVSKLEATIKYQNINEIYASKQHGTYDSNLIGTKNFSGYFGTQINGTQQNGDYLFSIWDNKPRARPLLRTVSTR